MTVSIVANEDSVGITLTGIDAALAIRRQLTIAMSDIKAASIMEVAEAKKSLGWRVGGGYFPGRFATGHFLSRKGIKGRQFWSVYRDKEVLVIELSNGPVWRVVLQTPDRVALAEQINTAVQRRSRPEANR